MTTSIAPYSNASTTRARSIPTKPRPKTAIITHDQQGELRVALKKQIKALFGLRHCETMTASSTSFRQRCKDAIAAYRAFDYANSAWRVKA